MIRRSAFLCCHDSPWKSTA